ncbi:citrate lyase subunit alpha [Rhodoplanes sp. TEM]|uniref:Citrate lyase alpha chain n=1 Tax=Rhodoplanes tepidamans TaxID=200616 RepID=A0ABT5J619_RHOTP|nr:MULTISPECIES: citrate lyase subunit alpha [Rhodoplanes]MDC7785065.1 citrate lyase subunit alpha [Rhodoplanes tepidamans]MDC7982539.1 citrate lyase subunit alpha [Rhodoplanes sp. TEM]MDQ0356554.1 citrate lyase subunit alpha/citrate CoA-transferase [Rhodoplanes tepidamans]
MTAAIRERLVGAPLPQGLEPFGGVTARAPHLATRESKCGRKLCSSLEDAIRASGLKNGMTISFHHAFREGDKIINLVVDTLAAMGFRDLTLAPSSLLSCNAPLIEHIRSGVIRRIYTSGMRGKLAEAISNGLMEEPINVHSHGGRVHLIDRGELTLDVAFLAVATADDFGNANAVSGRSRCGSLGYAMVDAARAGKVILLAEQLVPFPNAPASIRQDQVDLVVKVDQIGDPSKISVGAARITSNPRELLIARLAADVMEHSGWFENGFSLQTGTGGSATATARFLEQRMLKKGIKAAFALGGITGSIVDLHKKGLIGRILDTQSFDAVAAQSLAENPEHWEISTNTYANLTSKGACSDRVDMVILSALEIDLDFNVNVITGSDGVMRGASGGHSDVAAGANLPIVVGPLIRSRIPTVVERCTTVVTPGETIGVLVTDHGIAVNPNRPEVAERLKAAGLPVTTIEDLYGRAVALTGKPQPIEFLDKVVGLIRYRDGSVIDVVRQVKG